MHFIVFAYANIGGFLCSFRKNTKLKVCVQLVYSLQSLPQSNNKNIWNLIGFPLFVLCFPLPGLGGDVVQLIQRMEGEGRGPELPLHDDPFLGRRQTTVRNTGFQRQT